MTLPCTDMAISSSSPYPDCKVPLPDLTPSIPWQSAAHSVLPDALQHGTSNCWSGGYGVVADCHYSGRSRKCSKAAT